LGLNDKQESGSGFDPFSVETEDISRTITEYAKGFKLDPQMLDFDILSVGTIAVNEKEGNLAIFDTARGERVSRELMSDEKIKIYQRLNVRIRPYEEQPAKVDISLSSDKLFTRIIATIKKESKLIYYPQLDSYIYDEINKRLAKHKILIAVFENDLKMQIDNLVSMIKAGRKLTDDYKMVVAESKDFTPTEDDGITFYFEQKKKIDEDTPDFYNRGFIVGVSEGELLIEYKKARQGKSGRDVKGSFIQAPEPKINNIPIFQVTQNVNVEENDKIIRYIAGKSGYVIYNSLILDVQEELKVQEVSFKNTGSIIVDEDKNITLDITETNPIVDAVGSNMTAKANEVIVRGSVGDRAKIYAEKADIKGMTHSTSCVYAKNAEIAAHKGFLEAQTARVERLEGGEIVADTVHIGHASSGKVRARKVYITNLGSNCTINASMLIDITNILGTDNKFVFEIGATPTEEEFFEETKKKEASYSKIFSEKNDDLRKKLRIIEDNKESAMKVKQAIDEDTKKGLHPREAFVVKYSQFTKMLVAAKQAKEEIDELRVSLEAIRHDLAVFEDKLLDAKLVNHGAWINFQTVIFKIGSTQKEHKYIPTDGAKIREIGLFKISDSEYSVGALR
jgi:hypothetical protein